VTVPVILRAAPVATDAELMEPEDVQHHEMYSRFSLEPLPNREFTDVPIRVDHSKDEPPIGHVTALRVDESAYGGTWIYVHAKLDYPPQWLRKFTPVSVSRASVSSRTPWGAEWLLVQRAILTEVSLLRPGVKPAHPGARVEWIGKPEPTRSPAAGRGSSDRAPAVGGAEEGEVIYGGGRIRREFPALVTVRSARGEVIRHEPDGSQTIWASEADYRADSLAGIR